VTYSWVNAVDKMLAVVIELQGQMKEQARIAWKNLKEKNNITYISSRSVAPHITLESGFYGNYSQVKKVLKTVSRQFYPFYIQGGGIGIFVSETPVVHVRWKLNERFFLLKQLLAEALQRANQQKDITEFRININWEAKATLAFHDSSYENLYSILNTLKSDHFKKKMLVSGLSLYEYSAEEGEKKIAFFPFGI